MQYLRTNTATRVTVGPFLDKTDGVTPETALTVTNCKLTFVVDDGGVPTLVLDTNPTASGGSNDMVHITGDDAGYYDLELTAANVNYLGRAKLALTDAANHCPVFQEFMILPAVVYDALILGTDLLDASVVQWTGTNVASPDTAGYPKVTVKSGTGTGEVSLSSGKVDVNSIANDAITAAAIATDAIGSNEISAAAVTKIQNGLMTLAGYTAPDNSTIAAIAAYVDTEVAAIKAKTDQLVFSVANQLDANMLSINGNSTAAVNQALAAGTMVTGSAIAGTLSTTQMTTDLTKAVDDFYIGRVIIWTSGSLQNQAATITDYDGTTKTLTFSTVTAAPSAGNSFIII